VTQKSSLPKVSVTKKGQSSKWGGPALQSSESRDESEESGFSSIDRLSSAHEEDEELSSLSYPGSYSTSAHLYVGW
jgi:hypothetical protein